MNFRRKRGRGFCGGFNNSENSSVGVCQGYRRNMNTGGCANGGPGFGMGQGRGQGQGRMG